MIQLLPLLILLFTGALSICFNLSRISTYGCFAAVTLFVMDFFWTASPVLIRIFQVGKLDFNLTFSFERIEVFICSIVCSILFCLHLAKGGVKTNAKETNKIFGILNIFAFFMCLSIMSTNLFQFFIGVEALGIISVLFVGMDGKALQNSSRTFIFNKFASLIFLIAISLIATNLGGFGFDNIKKVCDAGEASKLALPAVLLLIACLCKGAQIPFSYWLQDAAKANTFASIFLHSATLVGIGIIFITKCYFLFEAFPHLKLVMIVIGSTTAFWMACCSLVHSNIKKIMACLTSSSVGIMFISCGLGEYSLALLYFICHAFFKSMLFLSFAYVIRAMLNEQNILKMGGLSKLIPGISDVVWISFLASIGFPFFVGFFAKISFLGSLHLSNRMYLAAFSIIINIISIIAMFRMIIVSMYGNTRAAEATLSRVSAYSATSTSPVWILITFAVFGSFMSWSIYEWGALHFGFGGVVYTREFFDYFIENIIELAQIGTAIILGLLMGKKAKRLHKSKISTFMLDIFKNGILHRLLIVIAKMLIYSILKMIAKANYKFMKYINRGFFKMLYIAGVSIGGKHKNLVFSHATWILLGITVSIATILLKGK